MSSEVRPAGVSPHAPVGFVGAGRMGGAMVRRLCGHGYDVRVHARRAEARAALADVGATPYDDPAEAVAGVDLVLSCLFDERQVVDVLDGPDGLIEHVEPGAVLVVHSTIGPDLVRALDARARRRDARVLDAPISGAVADILEGRLTVLAAGEQAVLDRVRPALATYTSNLVVAGEQVGAASSLKLVNNLLFAANAQLVAEAVRMAEALGLDQHLLYDALGVSSGGSQAMRRVAGMGSLDAFVERVQEFIAKDARTALDLAGAAGLDPAVLRHVVTHGPLDLVPTS